MKNYIPSKSSVAKNAKLEAPVRLCGACTVRDYSEIGQFTFVNDGTTFFRNTTVGRYCSIGKACEIGAPMHPVDWLTSSPVAFAAKRHFRNEDDIFPQSAFDQYKPTTIGSDVWIGSQCIISAGCDHRAWCDHWRWRGGDQGCRPLCHRRRHPCQIDQIPF